MFIVSLTYKTSMDLVEQHLAAHIDYLKQQYGLGNFLASGKKVPRTGGVILSNMESCEQLNAVLNQDPFKKNDLADYEITEFIPSMSCEKLKFLKQD